MRSMRNMKWISLFVVLCMLVSLLSACGGSGDSGSTNTKTDTAASTTDTTAKTEDKASTTEKADSDKADTAATGDKHDYSEPYTFTRYHNYDWWTIRPWAQDEASKWLAEKFNVTIEFSKPDADAAAHLNLMVASGELPDSIHMDLNDNMIKLARTGNLVPIDDLMEPGDHYDSNILPQTREHLKAEGVLYGVPNWARKGPTGGNDVWMYSKYQYEQAGSPSLKTFEDLYAYAKKLKESVPKTYQGADALPFMTGETADGLKLIRGFYRSFGGANTADLWTARIDGKVQSVFRDPVWRAATAELNKWYREGLFSETLLTDSPDQTNEKLSTGRAGLLWYDHSQDSVNRFNQILKETTGGADEYIILTDPVYPPQKDASVVYADEKQTPGGGQFLITKKAKNPQRIYDLTTFMLSKEGSINMMYGPKGGIWDELDADGNPILKTPESKVPSEEKDRLGIWFWAQPGHADNVDFTKFAVNAAQKPEDKDWVVTTQSEVLTPIMFVTDEYVGFNTLIDPQSDLGVKRTLIADTLKAEFPKIIMAKSDEEFSTLYDNLVKFLDTNGMKEIEAEYDKKYQENVEIQGFTAYPNK